MEKGLNIYFVTSIFPNYDSNNSIYGTTFLYKYAKELVKKNNKVTIIHMSRSYPKFFEIFAKFLSLIGIKKYEKFIIPNYIQNTKYYFFDGINVYRFRYKKIIPHTILSKTKSKKFSKKIVEIIGKDINKPDVIISDFVDCGLPIVSELKNTINCQLMQIIHKSDNLYLKKRNVQKLLPIINKWLFRSKPQKEELDKYITDYNYDFMFSGIVSNELSKSPKFRKKIRNLLFVGKLIKIKGLETIIKAIYECSIKDIRLDVIGSGPNENYYKELVNALGLANKVNFIGQVEHKKVFDYMEKADALVLISHETFGMVYVEAMSKACIPIGAYKEGIDGIVLNGNNGFLSHYGDYKELALLLNKICNMDSEQISNISKNAYKTAQKMTDEQLAKDLCKIIKEVNK